MHASNLMEGEAHSEMIESIEIKIEKLPDGDIWVSSPDFPMLDLRGGDSATVLNDILPVASRMFTPRPTCSLHRQVQTSRRAQAEDLRGSFRRVQPSSQDHIHSSGSACPRSAGLRCVMGNGRGRVLGDAEIQKIMKKVGYKYDTQHGTGNMYERIDDNSPTPPCVFVEHNITTEKLKDKLTANGLPIPSELR